MDAMKIIQMALDAAAQTSDEPHDGVSRNADGTITITRTFRLDPAAVADLGSARSGRAAPSGASANPSAAANAQDSAAAACCDSKGHDTPLENCKAKNPMFCPYHGVPAMKQSFEAIMKAQGLQNCGFDIVKKPSGAFAISVNCSPGAQPYVEKALDAFLGQQGMIQIVETANEPNGKASVMSSVFKQDTLQRPTDTEMLGEWTDALFEDEDIVATEQFGDLISMQAELEELAGKEIPTDEESAHLAELAQQAKDLYHKLKGQSDYKDIQDIADAILKGDELSESFEKTYGDAKALQSQLQQAKHDTWGTKINPVGFPGSDEVSSSGGAILKYDGDAMTEAKNALAEALENEDLDAAKLALHQMESAAEAAEKHLGKYKANVDAMIASLKACAEKGIGMKDAKGNGKQEKMAWFEAMGIAHPEELKKAKEAVTSGLPTPNATDKAAEALKSDPKPPSKKPKKTKEEEGEQKTDSDMVPGGSKKLEPIAHDESKFPAEITQAALDAAIASGKSLGGASGDHATLVTIDGKKYVAKAGTGSHAKHIHNEVIADQAYRAGGILAPDCKEYVFGGKTYKLAEFIEGKRLDQFMQSASEKQKEALRQDMLKGYPLDVLFSNWDVIGTSRDNVIVDKDGRAWRIDNGGSFAMAAQSNTKDMSYAKQNYDGKCAFEDWDATGGWSSRQWIDDYRTMRVDSKNKGVFDGYTTHQIFDSARRIDFGAAVKGLPQDIKDALAKPIREMREMATHAACAEMAGYRMGTSIHCGGKTISIDPVSIALDSLYDSAKAGCREFLQKKVGWSDTGWLSHNAGANKLYAPKPYPKPEPQEPKPPDPGVDYAQVVLTAVKSVNFHIDKGDYTPNENSIKAALALKPSLETLAADGNKKASGLLAAIGKIEDSAKGGHKSKITFATPSGFMDVAGLSIISNQAEIDAAKKALAPAHEKWVKVHAAWAKAKAAWDQKEMKASAESGSAPATSFEEFEKKFITSNLDTHGIAHGGGHPEINTVSKDAQKGTSFSVDSCKKKVRQYAMMGIPLSEMYFKNSDPVFYNGHTENGGYHISGSETSEKDFFEAVKYYEDHPDQFRSDMESYARHKAMMALVHYNILNDEVDRKTGTVFVMRGEHKQAWKKGPPSGTKIIPPYPIDSSTSACIEHTGHFGGCHIGWKLPIWRITDNFMIGTHGGEEEICINPIKIPHPPMIFKKDDVSGGWKHCMAIYNKQKEVLAADKVALGIMP